MILAEKAHRFEDSGPVPAGDILVTGPAVRLGSRGSAVKGLATPAT